MYRNSAQGAECVLCSAVYVCTICRDYLGSCHKIMSGLSPFYVAAFRLQPPAPVISYSGINITISLLGNLVISISVPSDPVLTSA